MYNFILTLHYYAYRTASRTGGLRGAGADRPGPDEEHLLQQPQEEQQYEEQQPGYHYVSEAAAELTPDPPEQGRHPKH